MRPNTDGVSRERRARFESFEERLALSAQPVGDLLLDTQSEVPEPAYSEVTTAAFDVHQASGVAAARNDFGFTGQGQTVAVIDTGIAYDHQALGGGYGSNHRVVGGWDFTEENDANPYDDGPAGFHGTHVAGIIASQDDTYTGVAPEADLVALRVVNDYGASEFEWIENALRWVHDNRNSFENPITTVNLSLGTDWNADTLPDFAMFEDEFAMLEADGIFISVAAGNSFQAYNTPGLSYPAVSEHVVPVASHDEDGTLSDFSQRNQDVLVAPGGNITSSVPGHLFGMPGASNFYMSASGTSMAAPYVAGASVLMREAMEFAGYQNVTQDMIYDQLRDSADLVYDNATEAYYHRLNLEQALDNLLPDEYGSNDATAFALGTIGDSSSLSGLIGRLSDQDYFSFTAGVSGNVRISIDGSHDLAASWTFTGAASIEGDQLSFDVVAGQTYTFALGTTDGLGYYDLRLEMDTVDIEPLPLPPPPADAVNWGQIDFASFTGETVAGSSQYELTAIRDGVLTVEAHFDRSQGEVSFDLHDSQGRLLASSSATGNGQRLDLTVRAGDVLKLRVHGTHGDVDFRVSNLVSMEDGLVQVHGTDANDTIEFRAGANHRLSINDVVYQIDGSQFSQIRIDGQGGNDSIRLIGSTANDTATLEVGGAQLVSSVYKVIASNLEVIDLIGGGGNDQLKMYDSAGDDTLIAKPDSVVLQGKGFKNTATGFARTEVYASTGNDLAHMYDSAGSDRFYGRADSALMRGTGFYNYAEGFDGVTAYAIAGGHLDRAWLYDSIGSDRLVAYPEHVTLSGDGFSNRAQGFERVYAYARSGRDEAFMYDSAGNDRFYARSTYSVMRGSDFYNYARGFDAVTAYANAGGSRDLAYLYGTAGAEVVTVSGANTEMRGRGFSSSANGFESVRTYGRGGADEAVFHEIGANDSFLGRSNLVRYRSEGHESRLYDFDVVSAHAANGETATADLQAVAYLFNQYGKWKK